MCCKVCIGAMHGTEPHRSARQPGLQVASHNSSIVNLLPSSCHRHALHNRTATIDTCCISTTLVYPSVQFPSLIFIITNYFWYFTCVQWSINIPVHSFCLRGTAIYDASATLAHFPSLISYLSLILGNFPNLSYPLCKSPGLGQAKPEPGRT